MFIHNESRNTNIEKKKHEQYEDITDRHTTIIVLLIDRPTDRTHEKKMTVNNQHALEWNRIALLLASITSSTN